MTSAESWSDDKASVTSSEDKTDGETCNMSGGGTEADSGDMQDGMESQSDHQRMLREFTANTHAISREVAMRFADRENSHSNGKCSRKRITAIQKTVNGLAAAYTAGVYGRSVAEVAKVAG